MCIALSSLLDEGKLVRSLFLCSPTHRFYFGVGVPHSVSLSFVPSPLPFLCPFLISFFPFFQFPFYILIFCFWCDFLLFPRRFFIFFPSLTLPSFLAFNQDLFVKAEPDRIARRLMTMERLTLGSLWSMYDLRLRVYELYQSKLI